MWPCRELWGPGGTWSSSWEHCVGHCVGCRSQAARRERKCGGPKLGTQGAASRGFSFQTLPAARSTARPTLEPGRAGWAKGRGTPRGQEGIPRALQEGDHSESNAKIQSRLRILPGGWGCGQPWGREWVGPQAFCSLPHPGISKAIEIQAGISMGSMTHSPQPPHNTHQGIKASFLLSGASREEASRSGDCAFPQTPTTGVHLYCQTQMRDPDPMQTTGVLPSHYRTEQGGPQVKDPLAHAPLPTF